MDILYTETDPTVIKYAEGPIDANLDSNLEAEDDFILRISDESDVESTDRENNNYKNLGSSNVDDNHIESTMQVVTDFKTEAHADLMTDDNDSNNNIINNILQDNMKHKMDQKQTTLLNFFTQYTKASAEKRYKTENNDTFNRVVNVGILIAQLQSAKVILERLPATIFVKYDTFNNDYKKTENYQNSSDDGNVALTSAKFRRHCPKCNATVAKARTTCDVCDSPLLFECAKCSVRYSIYGSLKYHLGVKCYPRRGFRCTECDYSHPFKRCVDVHMLKIHRADDASKGKKSRSYECAMCGEKSQYLWAARKHKAACWEKWNDVGESKAPKVKDKSAYEIDPIRFTKLPIHVSELSMIKRYCSKCNRTIQGGKHKERYCSNCKKAISYQCLRCNKEYSNYESIKYHLHSKCNPQNSFRCSKCNYTCSVRQLMRKHIKSSHRDKKLEGIKLAGNLLCSHCPFNTNRRSDLRCHLMNYHGDGNNFIDGDVHTDVIVTNIKAKQKINTITTDAIVRKEKLNKSGTSNSYDTEFTVVANIGTLNMIKTHCPDCKETFSECRRSCPNLGCHARLLYECVKCNKRYSSVQSMKYHLESKCNPHAYFQCTECDYKSSVKYLTIRHIRHFHGKSNQERKQICHKCDKECINRMGLKRHMIFCGKKPDKCKLCDYGSKYGQRLKNHYKTVHSAQIKDD